ncbi:MAG: EAL domain-containing protein [Gammaproteobacteria bacterium]|nr:EAL domain-containing protein [Gammaproteobacteria bacterium]
MGFASSIYREIAIVALLLFFLLISCGIFFLAYFYAKRNEVKVLTNQLKESDLTEQKLKNELTVLQNKFGSAIEDPVTKLLGWQLFEDRINQSIKESLRYHLTLAVLYIDINDFKVINDALGHEIGDLVLVEFAKRLELSVRQVDTVSRLTKDIFVVLLTQLSKPEMAAVVAQRMLQSIAEPIEVKEQQLYITACIGIAVYPVDGQDANALFRSADHALHAAQEKGKQIYQFYQEKINTNSQRELILANSLRRETVTEEFDIHYQPIVNVQNKKIVCIEVLPYWQHPSLGLINSEELYNCAEKHNKLNIITEWLLQRACQQFLLWRKEKASPQFLGIPLLMKQLENSQFIYRISQTLKDLQFNPEWLVLEIREDNASLSYDVIEKAINMLKYLNIKLAMLDFGASGFSLRHLKTLGFDFLKLDPSFVDDIETNPQAVALIKSFVFMADNLSVQLILQGVESKKQSEILQALGCSIMQGKIMGETLSEKEVAAKIAVPLQE